MSAVDFWLTLSFLTSPILLIPALAVLTSYLWYANEKKEAAIFAVSYFGGIILNKILKELFQAPRPSDPLIHVSGYGFPSGHAMSAMIFYSLLILLFYKKIKNKIAGNFFVVLNVLIILSVGLSRVMLKVHSVVDVLGGYVMGLLWLFLIFYLFRHKFDR